MRKGLHKSIMTKATLKQKTSLAIPLIFPFIEAPKLLLNFHFPKFEVMAAAKNQRVSFFTCKAFDLSRVLIMSESFET